MQHPLLQMAAQPIPVAVQQGYQPQVPIPQPQVPQPQINLGQQVYQQVPAQPNQPPQMMAQQAAYQPQMAQAVQPFLHIDPNQPVNATIFAYGLNEAMKSVLSHSRVMIREEKQKEFFGNLEHPYTCNMFLEKIDITAASQRLEERQAIALLHSACQGEAQNFVEKIKIKERATGKLYTYQEWSCPF